MVVGLHSRDNDLVVNPVKTKQLTNIRADGKDEAMLLTPRSATRSNRPSNSSPTTSSSRSLHPHPRKRLPLNHERKRASRAAALP
jgi:GTP-binding protein